MSPMELHIQINLVDERNQIEQGFWVRDNSIN